VTLQNQLGALGQLEQEHGKALLWFGRSQCNKSKQTTVIDGWGGGNNKHSMLDVVNMGRAWIWVWLEMLILR